jgi:hypothetical protein
MKSVKLIKRIKNETMTGDDASREEMTDRQSTREMVRTVKRWVAERNQRRLDEYSAALRSGSFEQHSY